MPQKSQGQRESEMWSEYASTAGQGNVIDREKYIAAGRKWVNLRLAAEGYPVAGEARAAAQEQERNTLTKEKTDPNLLRKIQERLAQKRRN
jgi:hypothetical protein